MKYRTSYDHNNALGKPRYSNYQSMTQRGDGDASRCEALHGPIDC